jgi:hypothetical protein
MDDEAEILAPARDYIESWLEGDGERMARCLHPALAKRAVDRDPSTGEAVVDESPYDAMVDAAGRGAGRRLAPGYELALLDRFGDIATVKVLSSAYMDYLHIAKVGERWLILNVLWQHRPST